MSRKRSSACDWCREEKSAKLLPAITTFRLTGKKKNPETWHLCWVHTFLLLTEWRNVFMFSWLAGFETKPRDRKIFRVDVSGPSFDVTDLKRKFLGGENEQ